MSNATDSLGLSCPSGGTPHVCQGSAARFLGCCDVDPCGDGGCPAASLRPASFNAERYSDIPSQGCADAATGAAWYTCLSGPFLGCCKSNPCQLDGVCPSEDLVAARLDEDPSRASMFLASSGPTKTAAASSSSTTDTDGDAPTSGAVSGDEAASQRRTKVIIGGVIGGIGGVVLLVLAACFFYRHYKKRRGNNRMSFPSSFTEGEDRITILNPPYASYPSSCTSSPSFPARDSRPNPPYAARGRQRGSYDAIFDPARNVAAPSTAGEKYQRAFRGRYVNYSLARGGRSPGFAVAAELQGSTPISELESPAPAPGREMSRGRGASYHGVEGAGPALRSGDGYSRSTGW